MKSNIRSHYKDIMFWINILLIVFVLSSPESVGKWFGKVAGGFEKSYNEIIK